MRNRLNDDRNDDSAAVYDNGSSPDNDRASADDHNDASDDDNRAAVLERRERVGGTVSDVTIYVPTAVMNLTANAPNGEVTEADIIKVQEGQLQSAAARIQELEVAVATIVNIAACALKVLADSGLSDAPDEFSFSYDLAERMRDTNITATRDFAGGITVKFRESSPAPILVER